MKYFTVWTVGGGNHATNAVELTKNEWINELVETLCSPRFELLKPFTIDSLKWVEFIDLEDDDGYGKAFFLSAE